MSSLEWMPDLAASLDELVPLDESSSPDWHDVVARTRKPRALVKIGLRRPHWHPRLAIVVALLLLLLAGCATVTYLLLRASPSGLIFPRTRGFSFAVLDARGSPSDIWRCPDTWNCGDIAGVGLSRDGRQLAIAIDALAARSPDIGGMHIIDLKTGSDQRLPASPRHRLTTEVFLRQERMFGCFDPKYIAWSPDGSQLAYTCGIATGRIYTIRPDGTGRHLVPTHTRNAYSPSWSPDSKRLAFSTCALPNNRKHMETMFDPPPCRSTVYVVNLDGRHLRRLAAGALPDWSPDGKTIAFAAPGCGRTRSSWRVRLVNPEGRDTTPAGSACEGIGPPGSVVPAWSPDGRRIAIGTQKALYVMNADGSGLERLLRGNFIHRGVGGFLKPLWQPPAKESK